MIDKERIEKYKKGFKCDCCQRKLKRGIVGYTKNKPICLFCYVNCESITGIPRCQIERKRIGGYWQDKRSNKFTRYDGKEEVRNQKEYFDRF